MARVSASITARLAEQNAVPEESQNWKVGNYHQPTNVVPSAMHSTKAQQPTSLSRCLLSIALLPLGTTESLGP